MHESVCCTYFNVSRLTVRSAWLNSYVIAQYCQFHHHDEQVYLSIYPNVFATYIQLFSLWVAVDCSERLVLLNIVYGQDSDLEAG